MKIYGHLCVKNESDRYLEHCLQWHNEFLDGIHVFDDCSTDDSVKVAESNGAVVSSQSIPFGQVSFMSNEALFRQEAWRKMIEVMQPETGDWILALDADEFFTSWEGSERDALERAILVTDLLRDVHAVNLRVDEVFDVEDDGTPWKRVDGYWNEISAVRLARYKPEFTFVPKKMGGGSVPSYVEHSYDARLEHYGLVHYGYAREADRQAKYQRYSGLEGNGHSSKHVESILKTPDLEPMLVKW